jgi:hypothetical protein
MGIAEVCSGLTRGEDGIWRSDRDVPVSYPQRGADNLRAVEADSWWFGHRNAVISALLSQDRPSLMADIGGGNGIVSLALQRANVSTILIEPNPAGARNARERGLDHVAQATLEQCQITPGTLPAAGLFDVLEHIEDSTGFLRRLRSLMTEDGRLVLTVPAYQALWSQADEHAGHYRRYTRGALVRELESAGWRIEFATYLFSFLPPVVALMRTLPYKLGLTEVKSEDNAQRDHSGGGAVLRALLRHEARRIERGKSIPFGGSVLTVARAS